MFTYNTYACKCVFNPILHFRLSLPRVCTLVLFINPRRACAERFTVVVSCVCVCVCVCLSEHAILAVRAIRSIMKDAIVFQICGNIKKVFFLKLSYSKVRAFFTHLGRGGHLLLMPIYSTCNVSYTLRYMFAYA